MKLSDLLAGEKVVGRFQKQNNRKALDLGLLAEEFIKMAEGVYGETISDLIGESAPSFEELNGLQFPWDTEEYEPLGQWFINNPSYIYSIILKLKERVKSGQDLATNAKHSEDRQMGARMAEEATNVVDAGYKLLSSLGAMPPEYLRQGKGANKKKGKWDW